MKTFAIVGCGRLGNVVVDAFLHDFLPDYKFVGAYSRTYKSAEMLAAMSDAPTAHHVKVLPARK